MLLPIDAPHLCKHMFSGGLIALCSLSFSEDCIFHESEFPFAQNTRMSRRAYIARRHRERADHGKQSAIVTSMQGTEVYKPVSKPAPAAQAKVE